MTPKSAKERDEEKETLDRLFSKLCEAIYGKSLNETGASLGH